MKKTKNLLSCVFAAGMIVVVILVVLYESDILVSGMLAGAHQSEFLWTTLLLRLLLLFLPLLADTLLYYIYMNPTFGYLGIILALCLPFVYPSEGRCISETEQ